MLTTPPEESFRDLTSHVHNWLIVPWIFLKMYFLLFLSTFRMSAVQTKCSYTTHQVRINFYHSYVYSTYRLRKPGSSPHFVETLVKLGRKFQRPYKLHIFLISVKSWIHQEISVKPSVCPFEYSSGRRHKINSNLLSKPACSTCSKIKKNRHWTYIFFFFFFKEKTLVIKDWANFFSYNFLTSSSYVRKCWSHIDTCYHSG